VPQPYGRADLSSPADVPERDRWARLRFAIIGPLLAAPPEPGDLQGTLARLAAKIWRHPITGADLRFGMSTIERWFYAARRRGDPIPALRNRARPRGRFASLSQALRDVLIAQYREHPGWTVQLHYDNLRAALAGPNQPSLPSYPTVRRFFRAQGMFRQRPARRRTDGALIAIERLEQREVRSFEVDHVGALWHLDFHHCSRQVLTRDGTWHTPVLLGVLDDRSRLACHLQWYLEETTRTLIHGLSQAFMKRGLPRVLLSDNGGPMIAEETNNGCKRLGILNLTTLPYCPYQNAKQEAFWGRIEGRLMPMLEGERGLTLDMLNQATQAWVEQEYHRTVHSEIGQTPLERYLAGPAVRRECPGPGPIADAFRIEVARQLRRSDGTVSLAGQRFEIASRYHHLQTIHLRYARWDLSRVDLVDPHTDTILCPVRPLDRSANASGQRRLREAPAIELSHVPPTTMAPLLKQLLAEYSATGLPPAYLHDPHTLNGQDDTP